MQLMQISFCLNLPIILLKFHNACQCGGWEDVSFWVFLSIILFIVCPESYTASEGSKSSNMYNIFFLWNNKLPTQIYESISSKSKIYPHQPLSFWVKELLYFEKVQLELWEKRNKNLEIRRKLDISLVLIKKEKKSKGSEEKVHINSFRHQITLRNR